MFKRLLVIAFLATPFTQFCGAMEPAKNKDATENEQKFVFMPDEEKLTKLFADNGGKDFIEKTDAIKQLAERTLLPGGIEIVKSMLLCQYANALGKMPYHLKTMVKIQAKMAFEAVFKEILKDFPEAQKELDLLKKEIKQLNKPDQSEN